MPERLREAVEHQGGDLAASLKPAACGPEADEAPAAAGLLRDATRTGERRDEYELLLGLIEEGVELHYGRPRLLDAGGDEDLALLLGDKLYALGLARLAALGDVEAVAELADTISLVAQAGAAGDVELREAAWAAGVRAIGWGAGPSVAAARRLGRREDPAAAQALRSAAAHPGS